ncbi:hypothetical protein [Planococcus sp. YIM B11945]
MTLVLKIILIIIMCISFMGAIADKEVRQSMTAICIASILATVTAFIWL